ncbi:ribosome assembly RNA-binding protein YhbY [Fusibacter ferrireducens]|uniref:Ribosome assembly RNA-binding protein YhbY n=1 Tax=Fusibacter ferrireducens TaxID=2785058 RepID=A0ABR9ZWN9_9FIRM|nr:ribosome assembly RNA-binding protein YhbY [Fusibacter ferrireducens]MBF4694880.1 ribosome assembly RNA-binding protein YhbY [Fusibacter ferrireducens]
MLTGKQRSYLKGLANKLKPLAQLGKEGISDRFLAQMNDLIEHHELVKVNVLDNSLEDATAAANEVAKALDAEFVQAIGNKFTIYRQSRENPMLEIPGADNTRVKINMMKKNQNASDKERLSKKGGRISKPLSGKKSKLKKLK